MTEKKPQNRGEQTREALLESAIEIFGRDGFHAASNRNLAKHAGVNQALIGYHFGGKQGLYLAVFEVIAEQIAGTMQPLVTEIQNVLGSIEGNSADHLDTYVQCMEKILFAFAILTTKEKISWARLVLREQQEPTEAFELLFNGVMGKVLGTLTRLVSLVTGKTEDDPSTRICALTLIGQVLVFRAANAAALRHMQWTHVHENELDIIHQHIHASLNALFKKGHTL